MFLTGQLRELPWRGVAISALRLSGHTNIAAALRHHARDPIRPIQLLEPSTGDFAGALVSPLVAGQNIVHYNPRSDAPHGPVTRAYPAVASKPL
jgi:hypothetical protein